MFRKLWALLTAPSPAIQDRAERRQARLLASLLLLLVVRAVAGVIYGEINPIFDPQWDTRYLFELVGFTAFFLLSYSLSRTRAYTLAAAIAVIGFCLGVFFVVFPYTDPLDMYWFVYLVVPILVASLYFSWRWTATLTTVNLAGMVLFTAAHPEISLTEHMPFTFVLLVAVLIIIMMQHRDRLERDRRAELAASEARYRLLTENFPNGGIVLFDHDLRCTLAEGSSLMTVGLSRETMEGKTLRELCPPHLYDQMARICRSVLGGETLVAEIPYMDCVWEVRVLPIRDAAGAIVAGLMISQDVTARVQAEDALRQERGLFLSGPVVVFKWAAQEGWPVEYVSPNVQDVFGYSPDYFEGERACFTHIIHPDDLPLVVPTPEVFTQPTLPSTEQEYRILDGRGEYRWVHDYTVVVWDAQQQAISHLRGYLLDITARRQAIDALRDHHDRLEEQVTARTAELIAANTRLQALSAAKDTFVSNVSHELRTPITNLRLYHGLLARNPADADDYLAVLQRETERLNRIIEDLLHLSRMDQDQEVVQVAAVDLNALVREYTTDRLPQIEGQDLTLAVHLRPGLPPVEADAGLLGQVLSILLTNAINYTPAGGQVTVHTLCDPAETADADCASPDRVGFRVKDTGPGFPPDEMVRLFERFFRGQAGRASGMPGTGLGLAIAQEIAQRHGGCLEAASDGDDQGASFTLWLPARPLPPEDAPLPPDGAPSVQSGG